MVDETENNIDEEEVFPSFLRSDKPENDINHFLDGEGNSVSSPDNSLNLGAWNDGFEDEEKNNSDLDLNFENVKLDLSSWDDIEEDNFLNNMEDINLDTGVNLDIFSKNSDEISTDVSTSSIIEHTDSVIEQVSDTSEDISLNIVAETKEVKYIDPEDYMSSNISLEELSSDETLMEEYAERDLSIPADSIRNASSKNLGNTFIDDLPTEDYSNTVSLLVPKIKHNKEMSGPEAAVIASNKKKEQEKFLMCQQYSGSIKDIYFEFSIECKEVAFAGNAVQNSIYVNIGISPYGWNIAFDNGINMNLSDVRIYQLRNGRLPADSGTLSYGNKKLRFSKVERIVYSNIPEYFHYGC